MHPLDLVGLVGEVLSWIGLGIGVPLLIIATIVRFVDGRWMETEIAFIQRDGSRVARWFANGVFHERPLRRDELSYVETGWGMGVVSANNPGRARIGEPPHLGRVTRTLGIVFACVGGVGLVASLLPLFL